MTTFLFHFHSGLRWILVLAVLVGLVRFLMLWIQEHEYTTFDSTLATVITALIDVQFLVGIVLFYLFSGGFSMLLRYRLEHAVTMLLVVLAAHISVRWKKRAGPVRARNSFVTLLVIILLIFVGVARLPQGWHF